jgi:hypothetical protein
MFAEKTMKKKCGIKKRNFGAIKSNAHVVWALRVVI